MSPPARPRAAFPLRAETPDGAFAGSRPVRHENSAFKVWKALHAFQTFLLFSCSIRVAAHETCTNPHRAFVQVSLTWIRAEGPLAPGVLRADPLGAEHGNPSARRPREAVPLPTRAGVRAWSRRGNPNVPHKKRGWSAGSGAAAPAPRRAAGWRGLSTWGNAGAARIARPMRSRLGAVQRTNRKFRA